MLVSKFKEIEDREISQKSLWRITFILGGLEQYSSSIRVPLEDWGHLCYSLLFCFGPTYFIKRWATHFQDVTLVNLERNYTKSCVLRL